MEDFTSGKVKILVCTHIIESGIDIAHANTMIIQFAELYGLAQLYQVAFFSLYVFFALLVDFLMHQNLYHICMINSLFA